MNTRNKEEKQEYQEWLSRKIKEIKAIEDPYQKQNNQIAFITVHNLFGKKLQKRR